LNNIKQRTILGNLGQLVGRVDTNRAAKSSRRKVSPLGLLRLLTINCRCIPEDNNEVKQGLEEKKDEKRFLRLVCLDVKINNWPTKLKTKQNEIYASF